jgi:hypothetical protein
VDEACLSSSQKNQATIGESWKCSKLHVTCTMQALQHNPFDFDENKDFVFYQ